MQLMDVLIYTVYMNRTLTIYTMCVSDDFKGIVHRKMKIHSLSTHNYADGGVSEVFESTKQFSSLRG